MQVTSTSSQHQIFGGFFQLETFGFTVSDFTTLKFTEALRTGPDHRKLLRTKVIPLFSLNAPKLGKRFLHHYKNIKYYLLSVSTYRIITTQKPASSSSATRKLGNSGHHHHYH